MARRVGAGNNGKLQATIFKKCDRAYHRPETNRQCAGGACQHTCEPSGTERCRHAWTVRYNVNGVQRDRSFRDEIDARKRVQWGTGLKKAQDFQLELTRGKRAQGKTYVDPKAGSELFGPACEAFIMSPALNAGEGSRGNYLSNYRNSARDRFAGRTLAQMATAQAAEEVTELPAHREQEPDRTGLLGESAGCLHRGEYDGKVVRSGAGGAEGPHVLGPKAAGELVDPPRPVGMGRTGNFHGRCQPLLGRTSSATPATRLRIQRG